MLDKIVRALILALLLPAIQAHAFSKGVASNPYLNTDPAKIYHLGASWGYHWGVNKPAAFGSMEFVPMLWNGGYVTVANINYLTNGGIAGDFTHLLGFNEPDLVDQANMTPEQAISYWPQLMATGLILGAPAVASPYIASQTNPAMYWIDHFMQLANAAGYRVDFIPLHFYVDFTNPAAPSWVQGFCADVYARFGKPLWITEIGSWNGTYGTPPTMQLSGNYMEDVLKMLETLPYVERVAWFTDQCWGTPACQYTSLYENTPNLTGLGQFYKNYPLQGVPGRVQAEDYTAFNDTTAGNAGAQYRLDNVDIEVCADFQGGWDLGWSAAGEWVEYSLAIAAAGNYDLSFRVAVPTGTQSIQLRLDGALFGGAISLPSTGGNQIWTSVVLNNMALPAGQHTLRVQSTTGGFNFNYIDIAPHQPIPGRLQAENFSRFSDTGTANNGAPSGALYRLQDLDLNVCADVGGGYNSAWTAAGEWSEYPILVSTAGGHNFSFRAASGLTYTATMQMQLDGVNFGPVLSVPPTGGWQNWYNFLLSNLALGAGQHTLRLTHQGGGFNLNYVDISYFGTPTVTPTITPYAGSPTSTYTVSPSATPTVVVCAAAFENFEAGFLANPQAYNDGVSTLGYSVLAAAANTGTRGLRINLNTTGGTWGAGMNFDSPLFNAQGIIDATARPRIKFWIKTDMAINFSVRFKEGSPAENGGESENWASGNQALAASAAWQLVSLDTATFTENMNNPSCQPNCGTLGDNLRDLQSIKQFEIQFATGIAAAVIDIDELIYEPLAGCAVSSPTATRTASPTFTATSSRTPSPSAVASASPTTTPSPSVTATASLTATPSRSMTLSASPSTTASPTLTRTSSPTPSASPSATPSPSLTGSGTASPSATPSRSRTNSPTATPTGTATSSSSPTFSPSPTASPSATPTSTYSISPTFSPTPVFTATATFTVSESFTVSPTFSTSPTPSSTHTPTSTLTATLTRSATPTASITPTPTPSETASPTLSATLTASASFTPSASSTRTASRTSTVTPSSTPSPSPSATRTYSLTLSFTGTPILVVAATATASLTFSPMASPTSTATQPLATPTRVGKKGNPKPLFVMAHPNPQGGLQLKLAVNFESDADSAMIEIYTKAMTQISLHEVRGPFMAGWNTLACPAAGICNGLYFVRVTGRLDSGENSPGATAKVYRLE